MILKKQETILNYDEIFTNTLCGVLLFCDNYFLFKVTVKCILGRSLMFVIEKVKTESGTMAHPGYKSSTAEWHGPAKEWEAVSTYRLPLKRWQRFWQPKLLKCSQIPQPQMAKTWIPLVVNLDPKVTRIIFLMTLPDPELWISFLCLFYPT